MYGKGNAEDPFQTKSQSTRILQKTESVSSLKVQLPISLLFPISDMEKKSFLLKAPNHLLHIESLLEVFPDAQLIFTHRPISQVLPSHISLTKFMIEQYGGTPDIKFQKR